MKADYTARSLGSMSGYRHCKHCGSIAHTSRKCPYRETAKKEAA